MTGLDPRLVTHQARDLRVHRLVGLLILLFVPSCQRLTTAVRQPV